jgi:hypothetical protein
VVIDLKTKLTLLREKLARERLVITKTALLRNGKNINTDFQDEKL